MFRLSWNVDIGDQVVAAVRSSSGRPWFSSADLLDLAYAYPLCGLARYFPQPTIWAVNTLAAPAYRRMREADRKQVADRMRRWLEIPASEADILANRWMSNRVRRACDNLSALSGKLPTRASLVGREYLERALKGGRGVLLVCLHSFAMVPAKHFLRHLGYPLISVRRVRAPKSAGRVARHWLETRVHRLGEKMLGSDAIPAEDPGCAMEVARRLRDGAAVCLSADVTASGTSVLVPFLKGRRPISGGVLELAQLCGCPVIPLIAGYSSDGIDIEIGKPLERFDLPTLIEELERQVRAYPDQWQKWLDPQTT